MYRPALSSLLAAVASLIPGPDAVRDAEADEVRQYDRTFTLRDGFTIERATGPPLVDRPIVAAFDERGRLHVADSSGSNDRVDKELAERPHRIVRLEDSDGDGRLDRRTVFADRMMFPEGAMLFDGSLYVAAPPSIGKLTDTDDDGEADRRVEWFQGKTLTGCANGLHGPSCSSRSARRPRRRGSPERRWPWRRRCEPCAALCVSDGRVCRTSDRGPSWGHSERV
jgi:hypothetical protein